MKDLRWLLICLICVNIVTSQSNRTCEKQEKTLIEDLNSINKCKAEGEKNVDAIPARHVILGFNSYKSRFFRKRRKELAKIANSISAKGISEEQKAVNLVNEKIDIKASEDLENKIFTFQNVDELPKFDNCENSQDNLRCFNIAIGSFIQENFEYPEEAIDNGIVGQVTISFVIGKEGKVTDVVAIDKENGKNILTKYSEDLISRLSKMKPAMKNGKPVQVSYELSLDFSL
ncbi:energy transducer TonB [uncultured Tenacibaculum sp.]|uniref:energy transducer TonB n=1 Tax=uncultured Tenacibaculum sp. TaxID=174713 RepID=UPI00261DA491|nr:energy transducer TonB [uncultured Tenacibaculum sp.]